MSAAASLSLLKGGKKAAVQEELEKPPAAEETAPETDENADEGDEEVVVDVDAMNTKEIDALVKEHEIDVPDNWSKMTLANKRKWLKEQFEEASDDAEEGTLSATDGHDAEGSPILEEPQEEPQEEAEEAAPAAAKPKGKGKVSKSKAVAKAATTGTIEKPGDDVISDLVHEIENMKEKEAREILSALTEETEMNMFKIGGVLSVIQANGWFAPYASFREYVESEQGMHYRKATYWVSIYNHMAESKVPWAKVKGLGWTKLKEIAEVITPENVDEWVKIASGQTTLQLIETVKAHKAKDNPKAIEDQTSKTVTTKTFKVHEDQKATIEAAITKAKEDSGTAADTVALEYICLDYMGGQSMAQRLQKMGLEAALEALEKAFPNTSISVEIEEEAA